MLVPVFVLARPLIAQSSFIPGADVNGEINVQVHATLNDGIGDYNPVTGLELTLYRSATDSIQLRTDDAGVLRFTIKPGSYRISSTAPVRYHGRNYRWNLPLVVERGMRVVDLTAANAVLATTGTGAQSARTPRVAAGLDEVPRETRPGQGVRWGRVVVPPRSERADSAPFASSMKGFLLGVHADGSALRADDSDETNSGAGGSLQLGVGFTHQLGLLADVTAAVINDGREQVALAHVDLLLRYAFTSPTRRLAPFIEGGFSGFGLTEEDAVTSTGRTADVSLVGPGFTLGGGVQYFVSPKFALLMGMKWTQGKFTTVKVGNISESGLDLKATTARFNLGFTWYPAAGR